MVKMNEMRGYLKLPPGGNLKGKWGASLRWRELWPGGVLRNRANCAENAKLDPRVQYVGARFGGRAGGEVLSWKCIVQNKGVFSEPVATGRQGGVRRGGNGRFGVGKG